ncbi:hypothetical protein QSU92_07905 [Microbacterium sp. ET2]|uniref:endonuclease domain-containing protein n=1 Tax=Microbacterium albipurpureum TaxID=3050384 RepID=UPI00259CC5A5|nr:hypothetical protein [Microbacterium sp. ET2 (Ac-2212)]WJL97076.1 hypothetical protein QSU92_07905 [Microbacterium sp. ET2 (Ac-2212)]
MPRESLPAELGPYFHVRDALRAGVSRARLRHPSLRRPFHGVRSLDPGRGSPWPDSIFGARGAPEDAHIDRARAYAAVAAEGAFFSHVTAAAIWGLPLPPKLLRDDTIDVSVWAPGRAPRGRGVRGHQAHEALAHVRRHPATGLLVTSPATTWAALAAVLPNVRDVVAVGDAAVRSWRTTPLAQLHELTAAAGAGRRVGVARLREALPQIRTRSASRPETHLRLVVVDAGLSEPELNYEVFDAGMYLGALDLAYPRLKIGLEYEGEHHLLDPDQWARDIARYERLTAAGWIIVRVTKTQLFSDPAELVARVRRAITARAQG